MTIGKSICTESAPGLTRFPPPPPNARITCASKFVLGWQGEAASMSVRLWFFLRGVGRRFSVLRRLRYHDGNIWGRIWQHGAGLDTLERDYYPRSLFQTCVNIYLFFWVGGGAGLVRKGRLYVGGNISDSVLYGSQVWKRKGCQSPRSTNCSDLASLDACSKSSARASEAWGLSAAALAVVRFRACFVYLWTWACV